MKKFTFLFSTLAVASTAMAVTPAVKQDFTNGQKPAPVQVSRTVIEGAKVFKGASAVNPVAAVRKAPAKAPGFSVSYEQPAGIFAKGLSQDGAGFNGLSIRKGPAYLPLTWQNTSVGANQFEWEYSAYDAEGKEVTVPFVGTDLVMTPSWSQIYGPVLYGMDDAGNDGMFVLGGVADNTGEIVDNNIIFEFGGPCDERISATESVDLGMTTYLYANNGGGFGTVPCMAYNPGDKDYDKKTGLDKVFTTPEPNGFGFDNPVFFGYANVFGAPAAPYVISKMWCLMEIQANKATTIYMDLYKLDDEGRISDELVASGSVAVNASSKADYGMITFDLFTLDEDGLQTDDPIVIDKGFFAIMSLNKDDFDLINAATGAGATYPANSENSPYSRHCAIALNIDGEDAYYFCPYSYYTDESYKTLMDVTDWMWMVDAVFPWTVAVDGETQAQAPVEGGTVSFNVNSYYSLEYFGYTLTDYVSGEQCDWIDFEKATLSVDEALQCEVLNLPVAPLPDGVAGRSAIVDIEGLATNLKLYVHQGESTGVNVVAVDRNAEYFDLQGRRVANPEKGIYIKKSGNKAEKVIF